ncbi:MAG: hypothetical protein AVDCRST_MAG51-394, partial [uncultured Ramlibacter sp.]
ENLSLHPPDVRPSVLWLGLARDRPDAPGFAPAGDETAGTGRPGPPDVRL